MECSGSVELCEGLPDKSSPWAIEGTHAHEVLEATMKSLIFGLSLEGLLAALDFKPTEEMLRLGRQAANFILGLHARTPGSDVLVETRIYLDFIHPEMFGTFDGAVVDHFGTLHVFDYKYGAGVFVSPTENLQMIFYAIGLAHRYQWNFKRIRVWIIQPRVKGYDGPLFWELETARLRSYVPVFKEGVARVLTRPTFKEGPWCHWCRGKGRCPLKLEAKAESARFLFSMVKL